MNLKDIKHPSFRAFLVMNHVPFTAATLLATLLTFIVFERLNVEATFLNERLANGTLLPTNLHDAWDKLRYAWILWLCMFLAFAAAGPAVALWTYRATRKRLERLETYVRLRTSGLEVEAFRPEGDDVLSTFEHSMLALADELAHREERLNADAGRQVFYGQLQRALEHADVEEEVYDIAARALTVVAPSRPAELLLADSSNAHLRRAVAAPDLPAPGCPVESPGRCAAVRRGHTLTFGSSESLDACPKLRGRGTSPVSAVCMPVGVMGRTIGVLHLLGPESGAMTGRPVEDLESLATQLGARLGMLRTLASTQLQAETDALTGLLNRRSFEARATAILREGRGCAVVLADLDHFKRLNDTAGHEAGDRALKLFANVLRATLRSTDLIGRHGGEEFALLLPVCDGECAVESVERVQKGLSLSVERANVPAFTVSAGVALAPAHGEDLQVLLRKADEALYEAKRTGRDRVVVSGAPAPAEEPPSEETEPSPSGRRIH